MKKLVISLVLSILLFAVMQGQTRDPFLWPFDEESIWNMPIHDNAVYYDIPVGDFPAHGRYGVDENHTLYLDASYPVESFYGNDGNWSSGRCTNSAGLIDNIHFPNDYVVPDAGGGNTPNNNYAFLLDDNQTTYTGNVLARCQQGGPVYGRSWNESGSVSGDGILGNTGQGASGMSAYGGTIRKEDIEQGEIKHAIKFTVWADEYFYYNSTSSSCYRWPANACDAYASNSGKYRGSNPNLVMGVLFAIDPNLDVSSMNFETSFAPVIFETLQKYGGYAVEDASWDKFYLIGDQGMRDKVMDLYGVELETQGNDTPWKRDMDKIIEALKIVDNNSSTTIGGGANSDHTNRLAPMACPLGTVGSGEMCDGSGGGSGSGEPVPWNEQFSFANGTTSDGGSTSWTSSRSGNFAVQSNQFECSGNGGEGVWESGVIDISSGAVDFSIDIQNTGDLESSGSYLDYLRIYTKVDGGSETLVEEKLGGFNSGNVETVTKADISGNELQIVIRALTTADNEFYNWDNIDVVSATSDTDPPAAPSGLSASGSDSSVSLNWDNNGESDLAGYNVYRSTSSGGSYSQINSSLVSSSDYTNNGVTNDTTYYYVVTAEDNSGNESGYSSEASATPSGGGTSNYYEDFNDNNAQGWIVFDGTWTAQNNQYEQSASQSLSLAYYDGNGFSDYTFTVEAQPHWNNNFGVVFNYQDNNNYYMLDLDTDPKNADLIEMQNGTPSTISSSSYTGGGSWQWYVIEVNNGSGSTTISINGNVEFDNISTNAFSDGKIGLHSKWNPVDFDNVEVNGSLKSARAITETIVLERDLRFDIYPNPVKELLNIELEEAADVKIYNSLGKLVYKGVASRGRNRINTSSYSNGLYLIKVSNDNWGKVRTVIIE